MSAPSFTPGPWEVSRDECGELFIKAPSSELPEHCVCNMGLVSDAAFEHDARLIAAAPELYGLLHELASAVATMAMPAEAVNRLEPLIGKSIALLAKARGETA
jgi:hypothetical protein